jgi:transposase InsO family protein
MQVLKTLYNVNTKGLRKINPEISYIKDIEVKRKYDSFNFFSKLLNQNKAIKKGSGKKLTIKEIAEISNLSKSEYYRIRTQTKYKGFTYWKYYNKQSTKPHNFRQSEISEEIRDIVLSIRQNNPTYSKVKINTILQRDYKNLNLKNISDSSVGRILKDFQLKSLITLKPNKLKNKDINKHLKIESDTRPRNFEGRHSQPWNFEEHFIGDITRNLNKDIKKDKTKMNKLERLKKNNKLINNKAKLGELIQIDHLKVRLNDLQMYEFSAIDPFTRILISQLYPSPNSRNAKDFLINKVLKQLPFLIKSIQVDGGSEFMKDFEETCKELNIPLYVLPPYRPKYNGRVERSNRTIREDFYFKNNELKHCNKLGEINEKLQEFIYKYNYYRPHQSLDYKTPMEYLNKYLVKNEGIFSQML